MSFGFAVYRDNGTVKLTESGGIATFVSTGAPGASVPLAGIPKSWVWYAPSAFYTQDPYVTEYNLPSYLCYATDQEIKFDFPSVYNPQIFWGLA